MKLKALDTIHVSAVKADSLRPGDEFEVNDVYGAALIKQHPTKFERVTDGSALSEKAEAAPPNKAESAPANKASTKRKKKGE